MYVYGFWLYEELRDLVGVTPAKHRGDSDDSYIDLTTPHGALFSVKVSSLRLELFRRDPRCVGVGCKRVGSLWLLESHHRKIPPHLNLYHVGEPIDQHIRLSRDGLVLMTKDHIIPKSKGGPTNLTNLQVMCSICNGMKGNWTPPKPKYNWDQKHEIQFF